MINSNFNRLELARFPLCFARQLAVESISISVFCVLAVGKNTNFSRNIVYRHYLSMFFITCVKELPLKYLFAHILSVLARSPSPSPSQLDSMLYILHSHHVSSRTTIMTHSRPTMCGHSAGEKAQEHEI